MVGVVEHNDGTRFIGVAAVDEGDLEPAYQRTRVAYASPGNLGCAPTVTLATTSAGGRSQSAWCGGRSTTVVPRRHPSGGRMGAARALLIAAQQVIQPASFHSGHACRLL